MGKDRFLLSLSFVSFLPSPFFFFLLDKKKTSLLLQSSSFSLSSFHVSCFHYKNSSSGSSGSGRSRHKFSFCCHETRETSPSVCQFNEGREGARRREGDAPSGHFRFICKERKKQRIEELTKMKMRIAKNRNRKEQTESRQTADAVATISYEF